MATLAGLLGALLLAPSPSPGVAAAASPGVPAGRGPVILFLVDNSASLPPLDPDEKRVEALEKMFAFLKGQPLPAHPLRREEGSLRRRRQPVSEQRPVDGFLLRVPEGPRSLSRAIRPARISGSSSSPTPSWTRSRRLGGHGSPARRGPQGLLHREDDQARRGSQDPAVRDPRRQSSQGRRAPGRRRAGPGSRARPRARGQRRQGRADGPVPRLLLRGRRDAPEEVRLPGGAPRGAEEDRAGGQADRGVPPGGRRVPLRRPPRPSPRPLPGAPAGAARALLPRARATWRSWSCRSASPRTSRSTSCTRWKRGDGGRRD